MSDMSTGGKWTKSWNAPRSLLSFNWRFSAPSLIALLPTNSQLADLDLRPFVHVERQVDELGTAGDLFDFGRDRRELKSLFAEHVAHDAGDLPDQAGSMNVSSRICAFASFSSRRFSRSPLSSSRRSRRS